MKKKLIISLMICLFISFSFIAYAYFTKVIEGSEHGITSSPDDSMVVEVNSYNEFVQAIRLYDTTNMEFNSDDNISDSLKRKTIKLNSNIKLFSNLLINADCHINLNNNEIDLNGYNMTFRYHYDGLYAVYGGSIIDSSIYDSDGNIIEGAVSGSIIIDCPNAIIDFEQAEIVNDVNVSVMNASEEQIVNSAMNLVISNIQNTGINDFYSIVDDVVMDNTTCDFNHNSSIGCVYTISDLDFIYNYYTYKDLIISYTSSNENVLSNNGNVYVDTVTNTVDLTIDISYGEVSLSKVISVHVLGTEEDYLRASNLILNKHLLKYYDEDISKLLFNNSFLLPKQNNYFGTTYSYVLTTSDENVYFDSSSNNDFFDFNSYSNHYLVSLSKDIVGLKITSTKNGNSYSSEYISVSGESSSIVDDNHSYAVNILRDLYNNQLFIQEDASTESGYTEYNNILIDPSVNGYVRLKNISYNLVNNNDETYELVDFPEYDENGNLNEEYLKYQMLRVNTNSSVEPNLDQSVFLSVTFTFTEAYDSEEFVFQIPVVYTPLVIEGDSGFDIFDPYYDYFDIQFENETNNYGFESFSMPLSYDGVKTNPVYTFIIYKETNNGFEKLVDGEMFTQSISNGSYTDFGLDTLMNITINPYYIDDDVDVRMYHFAYVPTFVNGSNITYYDNTTKESKTSLDDITIDITNYKYVSKLAVPGIIRCNNSESIKEEKFFDKEFYEIAYNALNDDAYEEGKFILFSEIENQIEKIDFSNSTVLSFSESDRDTYIDSLKGIELMKGIVFLTFENTDLVNGVELFVTELGYVSEITNLKVLNLSSTNIYDQAGNNWGFPEGTDNEILATLSNLVNLEELYLANNKFYSFDDLVNFASLKKVDITNNSFVVDYWDLLDGIFTSLVNTLYGTFGANNLAVVTTLRSNGVEVIDGDDDSGTLQIEMEQIVKVLSSLEYQDRLDKNVPISTLFELYPNGTSQGLCSYYGLTQEFNVDSDGEEIRFVFEQISFSPKTNSDSEEVGFIFIIQYHWYYDGSWFGMGATDEEIQFTYEYDVARY